MYMYIQQINFAQINIRLSLHMRQVTQVTYDNFFMLNKFNIHQTNYGSIQIDVDMYMYIQQINFAQINIRLSLHMISNISNTSNLLIISSFLCWLSFEMQQNVCFIFSNYFQTHVQDLHRYQLCDFDITKSMYQKCFYKMFLQNKNKYVNNFRVSNQYVLHFEKLLTIQQNYSIPIQNVFIKQKQIRKQFSSFKPICSTF
eukprot:TRINITY_DN4398_c1_g2_i4.p1 TRINITY_DN4398_c1_g2~~TRINITY_DN4398_c1_g2_i4.p1  ORF type:complete len:200 (+),score=-20.42 TRINITY_DN4398_c1_g2_i4:256-855(+)